MSGPFLHHLTKLYNKYVNNSGLFKIVEFFHFRCVCSTILNIDIMNMNSQYIQRLFKNIMKQESEKYLEYDLKQNDLVKICLIFPLNSANVSLLLSTISDSYTKMGNQDTAGPF